MTTGAVRAWRAVHTWTSLVCTVFLLMLCLTGLPLVYRREIDGLLRPEPPYPAAPAGARADLGAVAARAQAAYPRDFVRTVFLDDEARQVGVVMTPTVDGPFQPFHNLYFDARTGAPRVDERRDRPGVDVTGVLLRLHTDLFAGLPGELFLAAMGLVFTAALVSGLVLYAPFMRKLPFGAVRTGGSGRLAWLDLHNLLGVAALVWMLVVGVTGALNGLATPLFGVWEATEVTRALSARQGRPTVRPTADLQEAVRAAEAAAPGGRLDFVHFPSRFTHNPGHYVVWLKGDRTLTSRLLTPVMVDAVTGRVALVARMPWYLRAVEVSRPLHFGDYGGALLKLLWALLDVMTIAVLVTGLYLWFAKRRWSRRAPDLLEAEAAALAPAE